MRPDKMSYTKAIAIVDYWKKNDFKGRFKTTQTKLAEEFLANPSLYAKKYNIDNNVFYAQKSRNKKKKSEPP